MEGCRSGDCELSYPSSLWLWPTVIQDAKGLPLIILIRVSPFPPWTYSNALFAVSHLRPFVFTLTEHQLRPALSVYTSRVTLAIYGGYNLQLSKVSPLRFHRLPHGLIVGRKAEGTHGHS